jgi:glutamate N-acetyltransferase/amino-acid N-acetyltransferase
VTSTVEPTGAITAARGFRASAVHAGIREKAPDLALIASDREAAAAAVFTTNLVQAAPILVTREALETSGGRATAILVNAGNANACTGEQGLAAARTTAAEVASLLRVPASRVIVASTGVIGQPLPVDAVLRALPGAAAQLSTAGGRDAARAILTTDTRVKESLRTVRAARGAYTIGGMAKGSGMIHPDMATTLAFVTTDAEVDPPRLQASLRRATAVSFNRVTVDGDTSTNDMVAILANGASGVRVAAEDATAFEAALTEVLTDLARLVARDGEGATKLVTVAVSGAATEQDALQVARTIATSPLVKTAVHGADANWGRIVAAAGRAGVALQPERLRVRLGPVEVLSPGYVSSYSEQRAREALLGDDVVIGVDLGQGGATASYFTCDLTADYVAINASYRS